ncbi:MAG: hypothetical protein U0Q19_16930 [Kineosporiaceae bacterium]
MTASSQPAGSMPQQVATDPGGLGRLARQASSGVAVGVASAVGNVAGYLLVLVLARRLAPADFGAVGALLNLGVIAAVPAIGWQLVVARRTAADPGGRLAVVRGSLVIGWGVAASVVAAAPLLTRSLRLEDDVLAVILVGLTVVPVTLAFGAYGRMQGAGRFLPLALGMVTATCGRLLGAGLGSALHPSAPAVVAGGFVGAVVGGLVTLQLARGVRAARVARTERPDDARPVPSTRRLLAEAATTSVSMAGLLTLANLDVLLARGLLSADLSGRYVVGSLFAKAAFWGPQFLATVFYPRMVSAAGRATALRRAVELTCALGGLAVAITATVPAALIRLSAGPGYAELAGDLWLFAALGSALAVVQVLVYGRVAVADPWFGWLSWLTAAGVALATVVLRPGSIAGVVQVSLAGAVALAAAGLAIEVRSHRGSRGQ